MHHVVFGAGLLLRTGPAVRGDIEDDPGQVGMSSPHTHPGCSDHYPLIQASAGIPRDLPLLHDDHSSWGLSPMT